MLALSIPSFSFAGEECVKGASEQAVQCASDNSVFHRTSDWFATLGKSKEEKTALKAQRQADRKAKHEAKKAKKEAEKTQKKVEKAASDAQDKGKEVTKEAEKGLGNLKDALTGK
jgi:hypothetical protein